MNWIKRLAAVALFASSLILTGCGQSQIGSVDVDRVMAEAPRVKTLMAEAEGKMKEAQEKFQQDSASKELSEEEAMRLQMEFQRKIQGINQGYASQIRSRMDVVINEISQEKNIDVVLSNSKNDKTIFRGAIDITDDVIKKMQ